MTDSQPSEQGRAAPRRFGPMLMRSFALVAAIGVSAALAAVLATGLVLQRAYADENLQLLAQQAVYSAEIPIVFRDRDGLSRALQPIIDSQSVASIRVTAADGTVLLTANGRTNTPSAKIVPAFLMPEPARLPVTTAEVQIGTVELTGSGVGVGRLVIASIIGALLSIAAITVGTALIARRLRRAMVEPIEQIAEVAHAVCGDGGFHRRVPAADVAEVQVLASDFNALLSQLEAWQGEVNTTHEALLRRAIFDPLSGLPNRASFVESAHAALRAAQRNGGKVGILFMDGDNFKATNDRFGHAAGDRMIAQIAARMPPLLRVGDVVARMGGDEFAVLIHHVEDQEDASSVAARIEDVMQQPMQVTGQGMVAVSLSIGIALYPDDGDDVEGLLRIADDRMYQVKKARKAAQQVD